MSAHITCTLKQLGTRNRNRDGAIFNNIGSCHDICVKRIMSASRNVNVDCDVANVGSDADADGSDS